MVVVSPLPPVEVRSLAPLAPSQLGLPARTENHPPGRQFSTISFFEYLLSTFVMNVYYAWAKMSKT